MQTEAKFLFDMVLDTKAVSIEQVENGDLYIKGWASDFDPDREDEQFEPGAFDVGVKSFMETNPVLLYNHRFGPANALCLGQVEVMERRPMPNGKLGMWMEARVDHAEPNTEARQVYNQIKRGTMRGLSVGGKFYRRMVDGARKIWKADIMEVSVTPVPANPRGLATVGAKAFNDDETDAYDEILERLDRTSEVFDMALVKASGTTRSPA